MSSNSNNVIKNNKTFAAVFILAAAVLLCLLMTVTVNADETDNTESKNIRRMTIYYVSYSDDGDMLKYTNTGVLKTDGATSEISAKITETNVSIYVTNQHGQVYTALDPDIADAEQYYDEGDYCDKAKITFKKPGKATFSIYVPEDDEYEAVTYYLTLNIQGTQTKFYNQYTGTDGSEFTTAGDWLYSGETDSYNHSLYLDDRDPKLFIIAEGNTKYYSSDKSVLTINNSGCLTLKSAGTATVTAVLNSNGYEETYYCNVTVKKRPGSKTSTVSLSKPVLKCSKRTKGANKLTWSKVKGASKYILYVKYPGSKKYEKAVTKSSTIKSVTHRGLTRGMTYCYKVRAYVKKNGKAYYSPFSKVLKVKVK